MTFCTEIPTLNNEKIGSGMGCGSQSKLLVMVEVIPLPFMETEKPNPPF